MRQGPVGVVMRKGVVADKGRQTNEIDLELVYRIPNLSSLYERGTFCNIFHEQQDGWRNCVSCEEKFHCGCIMSCHLFEINDDASGICCKSCLCCEYLEVPSTGTSSPSNGGFSVQVVLGLPADGVASSDEAIDCTSEEEDNEAKAIPTLSASLEQTGNPGSPGTNSGVGPANLLSLIEESYFCPQVSSKSPQMKSETLRETAQKDVFDNSKVDTGALSE